MKTLHVPFHFYPESVGGTEVYALALVQRLIKMGDEASIAAPGEHRERYWHDGVQVHRFGVNPEAEISAFYGAGDALAAEQFDAILDETTPDLVHLHGMSPAISLALLRKIKRRGIPVIFTIHIPGIVCSRGTLLEHGTNVCDGVVSVSRCSRCALEAKGLPKLLAIGGALLPGAVGHAIAAGGGSGRWATALRMTELQSLRALMLQEFLSESDVIIVVSAWMREVLLRNGVPARKLVLCRHGMTQSHEEGANSRRKSSGPVTKIAYLGRLMSDKGVHILVDALRSRTDLAIELDIYGVIQGESGEDYARKLRCTADSRVRFYPPVPNADVPQRLRDYDALAIPSLVLETGPLAVYDAFAAGIPVIGSRRAGIAELVTDEYDGLLVAPGDVEAWSEVLARFSTNQDLREKLRVSVKPPRSMETVALEMVGLYQTIAVPTRKGVVGLIH